MLNTLAGIIASSGGAAAGGDFESIATVTVGSGGTSTITFSSIPSTYQHLQIRCLAKTASNDNDADQLYIRFNSDTATNYSFHDLIANGASVLAEAGTTTSTAKIVNIATSNANMGSSTFGVIVTDVLDYANTNKYKTVRSLGGFDRNGGGWVSFYSDNWRSTSAVTSISIAASSGTNILQYSSFALYGIKG